MGKRAKREPVKCQNCHTEMKPGKKTRSRVMEWTEYTCPACDSIWSVGKPLPGHEPVTVRTFVGVVEAVTEETVEEGGGG